MGEYEHAILLELQKVTHNNDQFVGVIDVVHEQIHEGRHFTMAVSFTKNVGENADVTLILPNDPDKEFHFDVSYSSSNSGSIALYKSPTIGAGGSDNTFNNNNGLSSNTPTVTSKSGATISATGTLIESEQVGGNGKGNSVLGNAGQNRREWIDRNKSYLIRFASTASSNIIVITVHYYYKPV